MRWLAIGVLATLTMDLSRAVLVGLRLIGPTPGDFAPRWIGYVLRGRVLHDDIAKSPPLPAEVPTFLPVHYVIGLALALLYLQLAQRAAGNFLWAGVYGVATTAFAYLLMFPAMGYGVLGVRFAGTSIWPTLLLHLVFGLALALWWRVLGR